MVDLVKIRKKAKKQGAEPEAQQAEQAAPAGDSEKTPGHSGPPPRHAGPPPRHPERSEGSGGAGGTTTPPTSDVSSAPSHPDPSLTLGMTGEALGMTGEALGMTAAGAAGTPAGTNKLDRFKEQAGKRREIDTTATVVEETAQLELLTFVIAGEHYAVDIEHIVEIVTPRNVTRIPNADPSVVGIVSLRGTIVTLVDVRRKLRHRTAAETGADTRVVVVDFQGETIGFVVDRVLRVVKLAAGEVEPHPVVHVSEQDDSVRGVFRVANALTILLDLDKLLDSRALAATLA